MTLVYTAAKCQTPFHRLWIRLQDRSSGVTFSHTSSRGF